MSVLHLQPTSIIAMVTCHVLLKNECKCFKRGFKHRERNGSTTPKAGVLLLFPSVWNPYSFPDPIVSLNRCGLIRTSKRRSLRQELPIQVFIGYLNANVSKGVSNTEKEMEARRRRRGAFIVSKCLEPILVPRSHRFS